MVVTSAMIRAKSNNKSREQKEAKRILYHEEVNLNIRPSLGGWERGGGWEIDPNLTGFFPRDFGLEYFGHFFKKISGNNLIWHVTVHVT